MGLFFGSPSDKYSQHEYPLPELEIRKLVSHEHVISLGHDEQVLVEQEIIRARMGDGKISLRKIDEILRHLMNTNKISKVDKKSLIKLFENYYAQHFTKTH